jgi:thiopeptide-type bacteriocin biosynthesis protein
MNDGWLQVNLAPFLPIPTVRPRWPWGALGRDVARWRAEGRFDLAFFQRKPPGLRLRFHGSGLGQSLEPVLAEWVLDRERANEIRFGRFTIYEPEERRFGGPAGLGAAHELFDADSQLTLAYEAAEAPPDRAVLSVGVTTALLLAALDDWAEVADVWHLLRAGLGGPPLAGSAALGPGGTPTFAAMATAPAATAPATATSAASSLTTARATAMAAAAAGKGPDHPLMEPARANAAQLGPRVRALADTGRLSRGLRGWLADATVFHWNRIGLTKPDLLAMTAVAEATIGPRDGA